MVDYTKPVDEEIFCKSVDPGTRTLTMPFHFYGETVPFNFTWDGASTPWFARGIVPKFYKSLKSSCAHDYLCRKAKNADERKIADKAYKRLLIEVEGYSKIRAQLAYQGVRLGAKFGCGVYY